MERQITTVPGTGSRKTRNSKAGVRYVGRLLIHPFFFQVGSPTSSYDLNQSSVLSSYAILLAFHFFRFPMQKMENITLGIGYKLTRQIVGGTRGSSRGIRRQSL